MTDLESLVIKISKKPPELSITFTNRVASVRGLGVMTINTWLTQISNVKASVVFAGYLSVRCITLCPGLQSSSSALANRGERLLSKKKFMLKQVTAHIQLQHQQEFHLSRTRMQQIQCYAPPGMHYTKCLLEYSLH